MRLMLWRWHFMQQAIKNSIELISFKFEARISKSETIFKLENFNFTNIDSRLRGNDNDGWYRFPPSSSATFLAKATKIKKTTKFKKATKDKSRE